MPGERNLRLLLSGMSPALRPGRFVFVTVPEAPPPWLDPLVLVREEEGITLVVPVDEAEAFGFAYTDVLGLITLGIHSALNAVGLTAAVATALAEVGISCNVVAGYHHDHLFVPVDRAGEALRVLERLAATA